jgi:hypothetical protein
LDAWLKTLLCGKKITAAKCKDVKTGSNLADSFMEGYGLKGSVLPVMIMMICLCTFRPS